MKKLQKFASPEYFYTQIYKLLPWLAWGVGLFMSYGILAGLFLAPPDYQQQYAVKIIYIHVPCALLSLTIYTIIGIMSIVYLIWKVKLADIVAKVSAPIGAVVTALALITGSLWGKPMWGTWWVWDARLTSELILLFLYLGYIGLRAGINDQRLAASSCSILAIAGLIDIPIVHFSVNWWHTLHQGATISRFAKPAIAPQMLYPLLSMLVAFYLFYALLVCMRARSEILWRERNTLWVKKCLQSF